MYYFIVETLQGKEIIKKDNLKDIKKEYDMYTNYEKSWLSMSRIYKEN